MGCNKQLHESDLQNSGRAMMVTCMSLNLNRSWEEFKLSDVPKFIFSKQMEQFDGETFNTNQMRAKASRIEIKNAGH